MQGNWIGLSSVLHPRQHRIGYILQVKKLNQQYQSTERTNSTDKSNIQ